MINYAYFALAMSFEIKKKRQLEEIMNEQYNGSSYMKDVYGKSSKTPEKDSEKIPLINESQSYGSQDNEDECQTGNQQVSLFNKKLPITADEAITCQFF